MASLIPYTSWNLVAERLPIIFPEGTPNRNFCVRDLSASTIFTMLYIGAIEGNDTYLAPIHVYRMTEEYSLLAEDEDRYGYKNGFDKKGFQPAGKRWYADNTRESIRDETLREGLSQVGAVLSLKDLDTTSSKPRYYLQKDFANLFVQD